MRAALRFIRHTPCLTLLVVQLLGVVLYPFLQDSAAGSAGRSVFSAFGIVVLLLTMRALRATPFFSWFSALVFGPAVLLLVASAAVDSDTLLAISAGFESVLYFYAGVSMLAYMLKDEDVTLDEMFAIPAVFTLFAWAFAYLFVVVQEVNPGAWGDPRPWMDLLFLSFTTLSSTGLSDIVPVTGHARSVIMLEQLAGIFYIAMVVTRLVALRTHRQRPPAG
ncbi:MAG: ion channel [Actinomycetes bacterium]